MDLRPGDRMLFYTTTGWMMWNFLVSSLLLGVQPVLYDGNPAYPGPDVLWRLVQDARVTFFGASPAYVDALTRAGIVPGRRFGLAALRAVMLAGSPVSAECSAWFYATSSDPARYAARGGRQPQRHGQPRLARCLRRLRPHAARLPDRLIPGRPWEPLSPAA